MYPTSDQTSAEGPIYPLQFINLADHLSADPAPAERLCLCGDLMIEVLEHVVSTDPPLGRYQRLPVWRLHGRGTAPLLILLKQLASRPQRYAAKDWLREHTRREAEAAISAKRLDDITPPLRGLLCPPEQHELRTLLVRYVHASSHSGDGYQLAAYPLVWLDSDAVAWNVQQAARMERFADDALPFWQRAYDLASRGTYLVDEPYSQWAYVLCRERHKEVKRGRVQVIWKKNLTVPTHRYPLAFGV